MSNGDTSPGWWQTSSWNPSNWNLFNTGPSGVSMQGAQPIWNPGNAVGTSSITPGGAGSAGGPATGLAGNLSGLGGALSGAATGPGAPLSGQTANYMRAGVPSQAMPGAGANSANLLAQLIQSRMGTLTGIPTGAAGAPRQF